MQFCFYTCNGLKLSIFSPLAMILLFIPSETFLLYFCLFYCQLQLDCNFAANYFLNHEVVFLFLLCSLPYQLLLPLSLPVPVVVIPSATYSFIFSTSLLTLLGITSSIVSIPYNGHF